MPHSAEMQECIRRGVECHHICLEAITYCLEHGGRHAEAAHVRLLADCAEICETTVNFMLRDSELHARVCAVCAEVCERCTRSCDQYGDDAQRQPGRQHDDVTPRAGPHEPIAPSRQQAARDDDEQHHHAVPHCSRARSATTSPPAPRLDVEGGLDRLPRIVDRDGHHEDSRQHLPIPDASRGELRIVPLTIGARGHVAATWPRAALPGGGLRGRTAPA